MLKMYHLPSVLDGRSLTGPLLQRPVARMSLGEPGILMPYEEFSETEITDGVGENTVAELNTTY